MRFQIVFYTYTFWHESPFRSVLRTIVQDSLHSNTRRNKKIILAVLTAACGAAIVQSYKNTRPTKMTRHIGKQVLDYLFNTLKVDIRDGFEIADLQDFNKDRVLKFSLPLLDKSYMEEAIPGAAQGGDDLVTEFWNYPSIYLCSMRHMLSKENDRYIHEIWMGLAQRDSGCDACILGSEATVKSELDDYFLLDLICNNPTRYLQEVQKSVMDYLQWIVSRKVDEVLCDWLNERRELYVGSLNNY